MAAKKKTSTKLVKNAKNSDARRAEQDVEIMNRQIKKQGTSKTSGTAADQELTSDEVSQTRNSRNRG